MRAPRPFVMALLATTLVLTAAGCGDDDESGGATDPSVAAADPASTISGSGTAEGPTIVIGVQDFGESAILAEVYGQALEHAGYDVDRQPLGGFRDLVYAAFESGDINFTAEYAASALEFLNDFAGEATSEIAPTVEALQTQLSGFDLEAFEPASAANSNAFVVTAETAEEKGLFNMSDLTDDLRLGGPADCVDNAACIPGLIETYGVDLSDSFVSLDGGGPLTIAALDGGEIDVAVMFSTSGVIADRGWVVLRDDEGMINADNVVPVVTDDLVTAYGPDMATVVDQVSAALTTEALTELNRQFDIDKSDPDTIAMDWLESEGFLS